MGAPSPGSAYQGLVLPPAGERAQSGAPHPLIRAAWETLFTARGLWAVLAGWEGLAASTWWLRHLPSPVGTVERDTLLSS